MGLVGFDQELVHIPCKTLDYSMNQFKISKFGSQMVR